MILTPARAVDAAAEGYGVPAATVMHPTTVQQRAARMAAVWLLATLRGRTIEDIAEAFEIRKALASTLLNRARKVWAGEPCRCRDFMQAARSAVDAMEAAHAVR
ncbi:MAG: hypothetical protein AAFR11_05545 [Pseudomonadota bacterium]